MRLSPRLFRASVASIVRAMVAGKAVELRCTSGGAPCADPERGVVFFPRWLLSAPVVWGSDDGAVVLDNSIHETGHIEHTDWARAQAWAETKVWPRFALSGVANCVDDVRVDAIRATQYPNFRAIKSQSFEAMIARGCIKRAERITDMRGVASLYYTYRAYIHRLGVHALDPLAETAKRKLTEQHPAIVSKLESLAQEVIWSMDECIEMCERVFAVIEEEFVVQDAPQGLDPEESDTQDGDDCPQEPDSEEPDPQDGDGSPQGLDPEGSHPQSGDHSSQEPDPDSGRSPSRIADPGDYDLGAIANFERALKALRLQTAAEGYIIRDPSQDSFDVVEFRNPDAYERILSSMRSEVRVLTARMRNNLISRQHRRKMATEKGRIWSKKLPSFRTSRMVFYRKEKARWVHTAVAVMVDMSGSVTLFKELLNEFMVAMNEGCSAVPGLSLLIAGFTTGWCGSDCPKERTKYGRCQPAVIRPFKGFDEPARSLEVRGKIGAFPGLGFHMTPLGDAVEYGAFALSRRREERKLLFVITDGLPETRCVANAPGLWYLRDRVTAAEDADIEVVGVGVNMAHSSLDMFQKRFFVQPGTVARDIGRFLVEKLV